MGKPFTIRPQPGPQEHFLSTCADIALYGGSAGGGKSYALLMEPLRHLNVEGFGAVIFRRTSPQIKNKGGLWDEAATLYPLIGGIPREQPTDWTFGTGVSVKFSHMEHESDRHNWQGSQIPLIGFDELTHFTATQFWYMLSRNRSVCGVKPYVRATCNPDADSWVAELIEWWIDKDTGYPIPERAGVMRWFVRVNDTLEWADDPQTLRDKYCEVDEDGEPYVIPKSFTFIPATLNDNKILMAKDPGYRANLMALPRVERERLLGGNWKVTHGDTEFTIDDFKMGNPQLDTSLRWFCCLDLAYTKKSYSNKTAWAIGCTDPHNNLYVVEASKRKLNPQEILDLLFNIYSRYKHMGLHTIHVEGHLVVETLVYNEMRRRNEWFKLEPLKPSMVGEAVSTGKANRIRTLEPALQFMRWGQAAMDAITELCAWNEHSKVDDLGDAVTYLRAIATPAHKQEPTKSQPQSKVYRKLQAAKLGDTGGPKFSQKRPQSLR